MEEGIINQSINEDHLNQDKILLKKILKALTKDNKDQFADYMTNHLGYQYSFTLQIVHSKHVLEFLNHLFNSKRDELAGEMWHK